MSRSTWRLRNAAGLAIELLADGSVVRIEHASLLVNLFAGTAMEGGPANLWLRSAGSVQALLGPQSPLRAVQAATRPEFAGQWGELAVRLQLQLDPTEASWCWRLRVENQGRAPCSLDLVHAQDLGLAQAAAVRLNEYYVSHYLDLSPLEHPVHGTVLAARQNLAQSGRHPWALMGSLRRAVGLATDAFQLWGLAAREGGMPAGLARGLGRQRLQHEHALLALQDAPLTLAPGEVAELGFFVRLLTDHPQATTAADLTEVDAALARLGAAVWSLDAPTLAAAPRSLFASAAMLATHELAADELEQAFPGPRRHEEWAADRQALLSFSHGEAAHVVLRAKELQVQRPHGHLLRTGNPLTPDESALTSTVWMGGVFHSMLTQGHVSFNRLLSCQRSLLGLFCSGGQRVFVELDGRWQRLGLPSAFEMREAGCRWLYRHAEGLIEVSSTAGRHDLGLQLRVLAGAPRRWLVSHHLALGGDDGSTPSEAPLQVSATAVAIGMPPGSEMAGRFADGHFVLRAAPGSTFARVGRDELLWDDARSQGQPWLCVVSEPVREFGLRIEGHLLPDPDVPQASLPLPRWQPGGDPATQRLLDLLPWLRHNALIHYLAPRGLEQFSGGGWGTRDVCQGPLEMLLALDRPAPVRDLLCRVFSAQNADGDWPQWFMFFERDAAIRAGDSHGDIVFWPLLGLARYLLASGDAALLDTALPFHGDEPAPVWAHVQRALAVIRARRIPGTALAAYGHGDWNDSLQPADPALRERLCSAWTVTLHHQTLETLARALRALGRTAEAMVLDAEAAAVAADFQRLLIHDGVVAGYALFGTQPGAAPERLLLHPRDADTGLHYSLLPMMHAMLDNLLSPAQAQAHLALVDAHLSGPDGARLFDKPLPYRGGLQRLFQRAETSAFFGREIGVMYMHAHLRWAETLAHLGRAEAFWLALQRANPIGLQALVPTASPRQSNCYYSSSDAAFADRYAAQDDYAAVNAGRVALDGGWRVYSSGPGIALGLVVGSLLGVRREHHSLLLDPVMPTSLDGLLATVEIDGLSVEIEYRVGPLGCGVRAVELNGRPLLWSRRANPYRSGPVEVAITELRGLWRSQGNRMRILTD